MLWMKGFHITSLEEASATVWEDTRAGAGAEGHAGEWVEEWEDGPDSEWEEDSVPRLKPGYHMHVCPFLIMSK